MINDRKDNQYYGKYRECCVVAILNGTAVDFKEDYDFSPEEKQRLFSEAKIIADFLGEGSAAYLGDHTMSASGDILFNDNSTIEIKTVSNGSGTYFNTSIYYFSKFGFDFKTYMETYGLYDQLTELFGELVKISKTNNSPVNIKDSSYIRHNFENIWREKIVPIDEKARAAFIKDLVEYFKQNTDKIYEFVSDMLDKNSATCQKSAPDRIVVLNYMTQTVREIDLQNFKDNISQNIRVTDKGMVIGNIRIAISWQNGIGLNNPTIRVFLED